MVPKTIAELIARVEAQGGKAEKIDDRLWDLYIARRSVEGDVFLTRVATVGYYVSGGKNKIVSSVHEVRDWLSRCPSVR